jgi:hypothetical protein
MKNGENTQTVLQATATAGPPRAKYTYRSGNVLFVPKHGLAPMLFLEFLRDYSKEQRRTIIPQVKEPTQSDEQDYFYIRMPDELRGTFADAVSYINANLPVD